jgi:hypothetical protein
MVESPAMNQASFTDAEFEQAKQEAESMYAKIGEVQCPYLGAKVAFNAKGLDHLKMKRWNHARSRSDQYVRLKLLHLAPEIIKKSHTLQGLDEGKKFERIKVHSRWEEKMIFVQYFEFIAVIKNRRMRIIVKKVDDGPYYFWSIVPYWKQGEFRRKMFEGDPETD